MKGPELRWLDWYLNQVAVPDEILRLSHVGGHAANMMREAKTVKVNKSHQ